MLMTLATKRVHNLPPHLSYVSTLPDIAQKTETRHWRAESESHWHLGPYSSGHHRQSHWPMSKHRCMHLWRQRDVTSNTYWLSPHNQLFSEPFQTIQNGSFVESLF